AAAPAARAQGDLARVAAAALPGPRRARHEPGAADARRARLRQRVWQAHARPGAVRRPHRRALRPRPPAPGVWTPAAAGLQPVRAAAPGFAPGRAVLNAGLSRRLYTARCPGPLDYVDSRQIQRDATRSGTRAAAGTAGRPAGRGRAHAAGAAHAAGGARRGHLP